MSDVATTLVSVVLTVAALPVLAASLYLMFLALIARRTAPPANVTPGFRFDIVVPAHNEESEIAHTVASLRAIDYPRQNFRVLVIADNCSDRTAEIAATAGAQVLVRQDTEHRGKGTRSRSRFAAASRMASATRSSSSMPIPWSRRICCRRSRRDSPAAHRHCRRTTASATRHRPGAPA